MPTLRHPSVSFAELLAPAVASKALAGAVVAVADGQGLLALEAAGFADRAAAAPMETDAVFWIASTTKSITGVAVMMLVDQGLVSLDDPVDKHFPEFKQLWVNAYAAPDCVLLRKPERMPTLREMMCHTSGMAFAGPTEWPLDQTPLEFAPRFYALTPLQSPPGTKYGYSNMGINLAGRILELVTGRRFEDWLDENLLGPLGMVDTTFWPSERQIARLAKAYTANADKTDLQETPIVQLVRPYHDRSRQPMPAGGYFSTAHDLVRFGRMLLNGGQLDGRRYLSEQAMAEIRRKQTPPAVAETYSVGFHVEGEGFGHGGALGNSLKVNPALDLVLVYNIQHAGYINDGQAVQAEVWKAACAKLGKKSV